MASVGALRLRLRRPLTLGVERLLCRLTVDRSWPDAVGQPCTGIRVAWERIAPGTKPAKHSTQRGGCTKLVTRCLEDR